MELKLKERFFNTYKFSNHRNNNNVKHITDADYVHEKEFIKTKK